MIIVCHEKASSVCPFTSQRYFCCLSKYFWLLLMIIKIAITPIATDPTAVIVIMRLVKIIKIRDHTSVIKEITSVVNEWFRLFVIINASFVILDNMSQVVVLSKNLIGSLSTFFMMSFLNDFDILVLTIAMMNH